jgi:L-asparaginase / beta-aspartyl-peptidase
MNKALMLVHGGAGKLSLQVREGKQDEYKEHLKEALLAGYSMIKRGKSSIDAVEIAVQVLENASCFTAGRGADVSHSGVCELDAAIMDGSSKAAGAVAGITIARNPISAARKVLEHSPYVLISGAGADVFARESGLDIVDPSYFITEEQWERLQEALRLEDKATKFGTVGAVAVDEHGNLAAGTSTGGLRNKRYGRVGDSPIIGAGTYADNETCAVSCTGQGEFFIRLVVAHDIAAAVKYKNLTVQEAADDVIGSKLTNVGGQGGVIVLDRFGNFAMRFNTEGMFRGLITADGYCETSIYE